jgi:hypothetical protein
MTADNKTVEIEISEEAYKQNTVYRPWSEIQAGIHATKPYTAPAQQESLKNQLSPT